MVGVTGFPTIDYDYAANRLATLPNLATIVEAPRAAYSEELGVEMTSDQLPGQLVVRVNGSDRHP